MSTIGALATAPAPAGLAVVRVSGERAREVLSALFKGLKSSPVDNPRKLVFGEVLDFQSGEPIDKGLGVFMPGPFSYTGEDIAEFQFHGSPLLVEKVLRSLFAYGVTPAEPGEFTKRAFLNGKLDLVQAEAVSDLINATSEESLKIASEAMRGKLSGFIEEVGTPLRESLAEIEASIDFPDEDISPQTLTQVKNSIQTVKEKIDSLVYSYHFGHVVREGFRVLLYGPVNAGKSSLLNLMLAKDRAIVSPEAGTTRDFIEETVNYEGFNFIFSDVAGIRETSDIVETEGVERAHDKVEWADLVWMVVDATTDNWREILEALHGRAKEVWLIVNKVDLNPSAIGSVMCSKCTRNYYVSAIKKTGREALFEGLIETLKGKSPGDTSLVVTHERHRKALVTASSALQSALEGIELPLEFLAVELRRALTSLDEIIGKTYTDDLLSVIFSKFCIGK